MTDEYLIERGYKKYEPTRFDNESVVARFQKRFDDDFGKKYFIDVLKWSHDYVPVDRRDKWWKPFTYHYETWNGERRTRVQIEFSFHIPWQTKRTENKGAD